MSQTLIYTPPRLALLRWITAAGPAVPADVSRIMFGEVFASPKAVIAGMFNGLMLNTVALLQNRGLTFAVFIVLDVLLVTARVLTEHKARAAAMRGRTANTDIYLISAIAWASLQGAVAFKAMLTGSEVLQLLAATTVMGLVGPVCARNYAAPRYALLLLMVMIFPFVAGAVLTGQVWMRVLVVQTPIFLYGMRTVILRFQRMAIDALQANLDSQHRARHDALTGLLNRAGMSEALTGHDVEAAKFSLFYLDLDGFKPVNDTFGHPAGDALLESVAARLRHGTRADDIVARLGGDEFVILVPGMGPAGAGSFAESLIHRIKDEPYPLEGVGPVRIGVSIGYVCAPEDGQGLKALQRQADAALYDAKAAGKGVHRRYQPPEPITERRAAATGLPAFLASPNDSERSCSAAQPSEQRLP